MNEMRQFKTGDHIITTTTEDGVFHHGQIIDMSDEHVTVNWDDWVNAMGRSVSTYTISAFNKWVCVSVITYDKLKNRNQNLSEILYSDN